MMRRLYSLPQEEEIHINLTPLIDVVFVVLIMFIIIAPMLELDRVQLSDAPVKENREVIAVRENSPVAIHVRADNSIWMNHTQVTEQELVHRLRLAKQHYPHQIPQLFHDKKALFGTYQMVKGAVETAGFEQLDIILQPTNLNQTR